MTAQRPSSNGLSWMHLVAAAEFGTSNLHRVRVRVRSSAALDPAERYRLVVQSFEAEPWALGVGAARPRSAATRAVTAAELRKGLDVELFDLGPDPRPESVTVVAWVEPGESDLECEGARARPGQGAMLGVAQAPMDGSVTIALGRGPRVSARAA